MIAQGIVAAAFRIFSVCLLVFAVRQALGLALLRTFPMFLPALITTVAFPAGIAVLLWLYARVLARNLLPEPTTIDESASLGESGVFSVGTVLLGLYFVATALTGIIEHWIAAPDQQAVLGSAYLDPIARGRFYATLFELFIGVVLILGSTALTRAYSNLRGRADRRGSGSDVS